MAMRIKKGAVRSDIDQGKDIIPVRLGEEDRKMLQASKQMLEQPKDSTALKQLAWIGYYVIHDNLNAKILKMVFENKRKNKQTGIIEYEF